MGQAVARALRAIDRYKVRPEEIDGMIIAAINVTLCLASCGDDRVAEGFNRDIRVSGGRFDRAVPRGPERRCQVAPVEPAPAWIAAIRHRLAKAAGVSSPGGRALVRACSQRCRPLPSLQPSTRWFESG